MAVSLKHSDHDHHKYSRFVCGHCGRIIDVPISCGNRFCNICQSSRQNRARFKIESLIKRLPKIQGFRLKMLTLSVPNTPDLQAGVDHLFKSFRRLRQRQYFKNRVVGGLIVCEITKSEAGWHPHLHILIQSMYLNFDVLLKLWCDVSGGLGVYIQNIPTKQAIFYVTKYICKTGLRGNDVITASNCLKGKRLFQPFGKWHNWSNSIPKYEFHCPKCGHNDLVYMDSIVSITNNKYRKYAYCDDVG